MKVSFQAPIIPESGTLVLLVAAERLLGPVAQELDVASGGTLARAMNGSRFTGKKDETLTILVPAGIGVDRVLLLGVGKPDQIDDGALQSAGGVVYAALEKAGPAAATVLAEGPDGCSTGADRMAALMAYGAQLRSYRFDQYKTTEKPDQKPTLQTLTFLTPEVEGAIAQFAKLEPVAAAVHAARDCVSEPPNVMTPAALAERARQVSVLGGDVEILDRSRLEAIGMRTLLAVAQGSANEPKVAVMRWNGDPAGPDAPPVAFIGKGVTFDTGGISIKPANGMEEMKFDMAGAAAVIGVMHALAGRKAKVNAVGVIGCVENMPSGTAQRPGDIVTSLSGQTVEIINTDAEGRLVLADALWYTQDRFKPKLMIDLATLTGAIIIALGHENAGLFSNNDELANQLTAAGRASGELVWRLPLAEAYDKDINADAADMRNIGTSRDAGSITAAQFLQRFVNQVPWAHLDIAGTAWLKKDTALAPKGATGFGVRLLDRFVADVFETG